MPTRIPLAPDGPEQCESLFVISRNIRCAGVLEIPSPPCNSASGSLSRSFNGDGDCFGGFFLSLYTISEHA